MISAMVLIAASPLFVGSTALTDSPARPTRPSHYRRQPAREHGRARHSAGWRGAAIRRTGAHVRQGQRRASRQLQVLGHLGGEVDVHGKLAAERVAIHGGLLAQALDQVPGRLNATASLCGDVEEPFQSGDKAIARPRLEADRTTTTTA